MAKALMCDECTTAIQENDMEARMWWFQIGWADGPVDHACSIECARILLESMEERRAEIEAETADA